MILFCKTKVEDVPAQHNTVLHELTILIDEMPVKIRATIHAAICTIEAPLACLALGVCVV